MASIRVLVMAMVFLYVSQSVNGQRGHGGTGGGGYGRGRGGWNNLPTRVDPDHNKFIVTLRGGVDVDAFIDNYERNDEHRGSHMRHKYKKALSGFAIQLGRTEDLNELLEDDSVLDIEEDRLFYATTENWGVDRTNQRNLPLDDNFDLDFSCDGADTHIYILDTGVQYNHEEFTGRTGLAYDATSNPSTSSVDSTDEHGHGTLCAGIAAELSKNALIHGVKVLGSDGSGWTSDILDGLYWVADQPFGKRVASLSLGSSGTSDSFNKAIADVFEKGVVVTVAAGNAGSNACNYSPAYVPMAITVAATQENDARASYSNYGPCVDIFAPGSDIRSALPGDVVNGKDTATAYPSGTSMACPLVAAAASLILCKGDGSGLTPADVVATLTGHSTKDKITALGTSSQSPNRLLYLGSDVEIIYTCKWNCDLELDPNRDCQCDSNCIGRGDCCQDYIPICQSDPIDLQGLAASQSSTIRGRSAPLAIDYGDNHESTCTHTRFWWPMLNWWRVNFNSESMCVSKVQILSADADDLIGADVYIGSNWCATILGTDQDGSTLTVMCVNGLGHSGQYVRIQKSWTSIKLCDIKMFAGNCE